MELVDFRQLFNNLRYKDTKQKVVVHMYVKDGDNYIFYSNEDTKIHSEYLMRNHAKGTIGEVFYNGEVLLVSLGASVSNKDMFRINIKKAMGHAFKRVDDETEVIFAESEHTEDAVYAFAIASYRFDFLTEKKSGKRLNLNGQGYSKVVELADAQNFARFLGDMPANIMTPTYFTEYAKLFLEREKIEIEVFDQEYMKKQGMNLLLSVSQGSVQEPRLLHLKYFGSSSKRVDVALVGKGVTFDTGGICLKPSANMFAMKYDMMGAATLLALFKLAASSKLPLNISATFPLVENMPSGTATKPGDVFFSMSGKSVEVDNTDAEGRLILADALTFAQRDKPEYLLDAATLTGAICVALGDVYGGFFSNNDRLASLIRAASEKSNDFLWQMPLSPIYGESLKSQVADINNMGGPGAGSAKAAEFLHAFIEDGVKWAHFDIAGLTNKSFNSDLYGETTTGRPLPALFELLKMLCE
ncbi:leucyl aminopeptidase [Pancytospora epiphaga]|nr:leucyl aminopeptidase [Pancytospora epiphaga]